MGRTSDAKTRLITAMADLVHRRGYVDVGVDDVCRAAGVRKGSFYYFFPSKRDLMLAALDRQWELGGALFGRAFEADVPPLERIGRFFSIAAQASARTKATKGHVLGCPFGNIAAEVASTEPALRRRVDRAFCAIAAIVREALEDARSRGDLPANVNLKETADALVAYFEGLVLLAKTRNDPGLIDRLGVRAIDLCVASRRPARPRRASHPQG
jgi:TetR/AcrR family transcriptional regulator, transcriptional repressor for nem operon